MAHNASPEKKLKKNLRLLSKKKGSSLRPDSSEHTAAEKKHDTHKTRTHAKEHDVKKSTRHDEVPAMKKSAEKIAHKSDVTHSHHESKKKSRPVAGHHAPASAGGPTSNIAHVMIGILIASLLIAFAFLWPYLPFNKGKVNIPTGNGDSVGTGTLGDIVFNDEEDDFDENFQVDENGFVIIDDDGNIQIQEPLEVEKSMESELEGLVPVENATPPVVVSTPAEDVPETAPVVEVTQQPVVYTTPNPVPVKTRGDWNFLYVNTETFELDDEDDDVTDLYLKDVCKSVYKQNANIVTHCRETSKLKKSTADELGEEKCDGGGTCAIGQTCLLWNSKEEDNGDLKAYTAMYRCE